MHHLKTKGFVIRSAAFGDSDRLVSLLTPDHGLLRAFAKSARRQKSHLRLGTQDFVFGQYEIFHYKDRNQIDSADMIDSFFELQQDMDKLVCAAHMMEVLYDASSYGEAHSELYQLCAYTLQALRQYSDPLFIVHIAQMRIMAAAGLAPMLDTCVVCGLSFLSQENKQSYFFSVGHCGVVCERAGCRNKTPDLYHLSNGVLACLKHSLNAPYQKLFNIKVSADVRQRFIALSQSYLIHQMEKPYTRISMLNDLNAIQLDNS